MNSAYAPVVAYNSHAHSFARAYQNCVNRAKHLFEMPNSLI